jgi:lipoprotein NlpI
MDADAYRSRGYDYFGKGDFASAGADFDRTLALRIDSYPMLWRFLATGRGGKDGSAELTAKAAQLKSKDWPYPVVEFYIGRRSMEELASAAATADQRCEMQFYLGEWHLLQHQSIEAAAELRKAADSCPKDFIERAGAMAELKRLEP